MPLIELPWRDEKTIEYPGVEIELVWGSEHREKESQPGHFILVKGTGMVRNLMSAVSEIDVRNIVDVGIYRGGSAVLFNECFKPAKLVALDLRPAPDVLREYAAEQEGDALEVHDGVDQANGARLVEICDAAFGDEPIDLIVDDASHFYAQSRATFSYLFPRVRKGGLYVIEDWGWAHWPGDFWQAERGGDYFSEQPPLSNLLTEIMLLTASQEEVASRIDVTGRAAYVTRGSAEIDGPLDLDELVLNRGEPLSWVGKPSKLEA